MNLFDDEAGYDRDDPKHPDWADAMADRADMDRKREKEDRAEADDRDFALVRTLVNQLDEAISDLYSAGKLGGALPEKCKDLPDDVRDKLLSMGASMNDFVFWVRQRAQADDIGESRMFWAQEVEAGTGAWGVTAREALDRYFRADVLEGGG